MNQIPKNQVIAMLLGELTPEEVAAIQNAAQADAELAACIESCRSLVHDLQAAKAYEHHFNVQPGMIDRLTDLFPKMAPDRSSVAAVVEYIASLIFDSDRESGLVPGFRGGGSGRIVRFRCEGTEIEMRLTAEPSLAGGYADAPIAVLGRVSGANEDRAERVRAVDQRGRQFESAIDDDGYFDMRIERGQYDLKFTGQRRCVVISALDVGV